MTWAVYGDPADPPRYGLLTLDYAQAFTDWPLVQMQALGAARDQRRQEVAAVSGGSVYAEYLEETDASEGGGMARPTAAVNDPSRQPANRS